MQCTRCYIIMTENSDGSISCQICGQGYNPRDIEDEFGDDEDFDDVGEYDELPISDKTIDFITEHRGVDFADEFDDDDDFLVDDDDLPG